ncbi:MAG: hypothetical protein QXX16_05785 [Nitrososphaerota archaeon]
MELPQIKEIIAKLLSLEWFKKIEEIVAVVIVVASIAIISGVVRILTTQSIPLYGIRVFAPSMAFQTYAEFIVVLVYYLLGTAGIFLYYLAVRQRFSERGNNYAILGATLLVLFSIIGILTGITSKF